ncbi:helix-turn-helix domain-containing protein [Actinoplanes friuliensis]|uniref:Regulatory protein ArsR n=1 Tax=Actinoplanes friuliensis DSM 7358 TaxID=1246995 RepID=U5W2V3_9ACTN|nr:helix-turn-helix domain-containing protein [Actinoplanes friuliensis]AGZ43538.1 regulatory protein ArsR [Actinoplanes friuliensis DSM 7358]
MRELELREPAQFKALGHPLRHRLVIALRQRPATLAQLAAALDVAKGTVGYHVKVLQEAGLLRVAHERQVRGGTEQYFEPASERLRIAADAPVGGEFLVAAALGEMVPASDRTMLRHVRMTTAQAAEVAAMLESLTLPEDNDGLPYSVLLSVYRANVPVLPAEQ